MKPALLAALELKITKSVNKQYPISLKLKHAVKTQWPYQAEHFLSTHDSSNALKLLLNSLNYSGCSIAVETPMPLTLLDLINQLNIRIIPVECDNFGPIPEKVIAALKQNPIAFIYQPRAQTPTGYTINKKRLKELALLFRWQKNTFIIENDLIGDICQNHSLSLANYYPEQTVYIRSYARTYGKEVGIAVLSGPENLLLSLQNQRDYMNYNNDLLQNALAWLIEDEKTQTVIKKARREYKKRLTKLVDALHRRGMNITLYDGFCLWLPVASEQYSVSVLASQGVLVIAGNHFRSNEDKKISGHIRVATSHLQDKDIDSVADAISRVCR